MTVIHNPILRGFNPDPSILRVGDDYYIATSTFEWCPGVQIHHSKDLVHWRLLTHVLTRPSQLDMRGNPNSSGVWAPCLTYDQGVFYLIYTNTCFWEGPYDDTPNYLVTAPAITGPWSDPIFLNSSGFDPSLFHDEDGRKWLVNMIWDHRQGKNPFAGIALQEYSETEKKLVGPVRNIFTGTHLGVTEGPHLYRRNGYYYLLTAEGGTGYHHAVTIARSRTLEGPYEVDPQNPVLTSIGHPELRLQKAGHADLVETQTGKWYMPHLCGRPLMPEQRCTLGRETAIQKVHWTEDGWLRLDAGGNTPQDAAPAPDLPPHPFAPETSRDDFDSAQWNVHLSTLRVFADPSWVSLAERPGYLRLVGRQSLSSKHLQSLVAHRLQSLDATITTCLEFEPEHFQQMAGLICFYDTDNYLYLRISHNEMLGRCLGILQMEQGTYSEPLIDHEVSLAGVDRCHLRMELHPRHLQFSYSLAGVDWIPVGPVFDASLLSDEHAIGLFTEHFTGAMVGICCQDIAGTRRFADFDYFDYQEHA